jgi:hypothetical protein
LTRPHFQVPIPVAIVFFGFECKTDIGGVEGHSKEEFPYY